MSITYRWLGVAGLEFTCDAYTLLIDPFFTRPGKAAVLAGRRVLADARLVARHVPRADAVLITHPHYDHLLDVPEVLRQTHASAFGSPNTKALLALHGIPREQTSVIQVGDRFALGPFTVEVFPCRHTRIPFARWLNGSLPARLQNGPARLPLRLSDYRMDACYSFNIRVDGRALQVGKYPVAADTLFLSPYDSDQSLDITLRTIRPRRIIPIHWDDFTRPLSRPLQPMILTPAQGLRPVIPPVRRLDLNRFSRQVQQILPEAEVQIPKIFAAYKI